MYGPIFQAVGLGCILPSGKRLADPKPDAPTVHFHRWADMWRGLISPELALAEAYAAKNITISDGDIYDLLLKLVDYDPKRTPVSILARIFFLIRSPFDIFFEGFSPQRAKKNVHTHYDLGNEFYRLFLDDDMQYSCAYFKTSDQDLACAQQQKKDHIIKKLQIAPGMDILDIGCGWGGLSLDLARNGTKVTGLTLSEEQHRLAQSRQQDTNLDATFKLQDYRLEGGVYDRIVSVGMFEHVGHWQFQRYFKQIKKNLASDGVAVVHTIGRPKPPRRVNAFITKYIFPGGYLPSLSQIAKTVERTGLLITDVECLYQHYAETLRHWRHNFLANRDQAVAMYDERFALIWEFYLASCEAAFRANQLLVFQLQLKCRNTPTDLTRDYLYDSP
jgi:cyclopropane-fatty-acyl-phospholipid synthase